jgi:hypothetical protein
LTAASVHWRPQGSGDVHRFRCALANNWRTIAHRSLSSKTKAALPSSEAERGSPWRGSRPNSPSHLPFGLSLKDGYDRASGPTRGGRRTSASRCTTGRSISTGASYERVSIVPIIPLRMTIGVKRGDHLAPECEHGTWKFAGAPTSSGRRRSGAAPLVSASPPLSGSRRAASARSSRARRSGGATSTGVDPPWNESSGD